MKELTRSTVLALYDSNAKTKIRADASTYRLGAVLLQSHEGEEWKPIAYTSKSMTKTEKCYSQIEKEALALALVWACEKFADYVISKHIQIERPQIPGTSTGCNATGQVATENIEISTTPHKI